MWFEMRTLLPSSWPAIFLFSSSAATSAVAALGLLGAAVTAEADFDGGSRNEGNAEAGRGLTLRSCAAVALIFYCSRERIWMGDGDGDDDGVREEDQCRTRSAFREIWKNSSRRSLGRITFLHIGQGAVKVLVGRLRIDLFEPPSSPSPKPRSRSITVTFTQLTRGIRDLLTSEQELNSSAARLTRSPARLAADQYRPWRTDLL